MLDLFKYEIEGIIEKFIPLRKQGKRSRKKHLSKEGIRKIAHKQMLWSVYKHTGNVEDYTNYKDALNLATTEIRKSKRTFEKKLAGNIKKFRFRSDSDSVKGGEQGEWVIVTKGECVIMGDCNHGHIQWESLESDDHQLLLHSTRGR